MAIGKHARYFMRPRNCMARRRPDAESRSAAAASCGAICITSRKLAAAPPAAFRESPVRKLMLIICAACTIPAGCSFTDRTTNPCALNKDRSAAYIPSQEMVGRIIQNIRPRKPALAIGDAQGDITARAQAGFDLFHKVHRRGLMLQHFEKGYYVEFFTRIFFGKFRNGQPKNARQAKLLPRKASGTSIEFHAAYRIACVSSRCQKIPCATPDIQQIAAARREWIAEKVSMARLKRHQFFVPAAVHLFIPARIRHYARLPKLQTAGSALIEPRSFRIVPSRRPAHSFCRLGMREKTLLPARRCPMRTPRFSDSRSFAKGCSSFSRAWPLLSFLQKREILQTICEGILYISFEASPEDISDHIPRPMR